MSTMFSKKRLLPKLISTAVISAGVVLSGCSDNDDNDSTPRAEFEVTVTNLTAAQPLSPVALTLHDAAWSGFSVGYAASTALEQLAEGGDNDAYLEEAEADVLVYEVESGADAIGPGASETIQISVREDLLGTLSFSLVSMLVNTNDAIAAINAQSLASMSVDSVMTFDALSYDTGTEANTESEDTIPGPAGGTGAREGFNAARDDIRDEIHVHAGAVTQEDGLSGSALTGMHKWDHPLALIKVERVQ